MATLPLDPYEQSLCPENRQYNARSIYYIKSTMASISGATAGLLGLTNLSGFAFYIMSSMSVAGLVYLITTEQQPRKYIKGGLPELLLSGLLDNALSFILFWTLFYGLVHIYD
ncbi:hypothetical protein E5Q_00799 [Mixia osmundae IAM 14324]|uniref:ER membrane protein complex subunit 6 n=1 Tax=Mixia osmundae (strain CBS 9802 / IAM 14324 / JCM 22182 / KY 12970) TaxID=764103 RepID=G7DU91_MIXOS|nr:hypothetical protein E5Q_00799 [Mixia osmundae IAM 14324]